MIFEPLFCEIDIDGLVHGGISHATDVIGLDRQLPHPITSVYEHSEFDPPRPTKIDKGIHRRPYSASREEHIVDQDDCFVVDGEGKFGLADNGCRADAGPIIAIEGDIENTYERS